MFSVADYDPAFVVRERHRSPTKRPNHLGLIRSAHVDDSEALAALDAELVVLAARRRAVTRRLAHYRHRLWPESERRHGRRRPGVDEAAFAPAASDAEALWGDRLRHTITALHRHHGQLSLRELHGLIHLSGFVVDGDRPVQRLADAAAYEVRQGRLRWVQRGVYEPVLPPPAVVPPDLYPWRRPDLPSEVPIDSRCAIDPERWSTGEWPAVAQFGEPDLGVSGADVEQTLTSHGTSCAGDIVRIRARLAGVIADRLGPPPSQTRRTGDRRETGSDAESTFAPSDDGSPEVEPSDEELLPPTGSGRPSPGPQPNRPQNPPNPPPHIPNPPTPPDGPDEPIGSDSSTNRNLWRSAEETGGGSDG